MRSRSVHHRWTRCDARLSFIAVLFLMASLMFGEGTVLGELPMVPLKKQEGDIRIATYNVSLYGRQAGQIRDRLTTGQDAQAKKIASIIQTIRPDILLINELDHDENGQTAQMLHDLYFAKAFGNQKPIRYAHVHSFSSNTGIDSGLDLDADGKTGQPNDAWGYGVYPGQYAMAVFSRFEVDPKAIRTFQTFLWRDLQGALQPINPTDQQPYYSSDAWEQLRLSSKNHVDVPVDVNGKVIHLLASHPTPPVFDGPDDHNGCRNHDEIKFWTFYVSESGQQKFVDDQGRSGSLQNGASFVIAGDLNADPEFGDGRREAIKELLGHPRTLDVQPQGQGTSDDRQSNRVFNPLATADFGRNGLMRVDHVIPSSDLNVVQSGVFWPSKSDETRTWITASDHRLVWVDVR